MSLTSLVLSFLPLPMVLIVVSARNSNLPQYMKIQEFNYDEENTSPRGETSQGAFPLPQHHHAAPPLYPFRNISLAWDVRTADLVSRLTLDEIQLQMARGGATAYGGPAPAIPRLGIGAYQWNTECLHGDAETAGNATAFPQALGLAASFSQQLVYEVAMAIGAEVRGKHNTFVAKGVFADHTGSSCFSPVVNIMRDPRWGRNQETYGEDPFLTGQLAESFVQGLQGDHPRYIRANAGCKHFDVHGGPENIPVSRMSFDAQVSDRDWHMTFLPAFKACVDAGTFSVMCSYNSVNGIPSCANKQLLTDILREEFGFKGYVVSDQTAIENIISFHHYLNNSVDVAAASVSAGVNLELSYNNVNPVFLSIVEAVKQGKLSSSLVKERVAPLFYTRMRLGEFDPPGMNPYSRLDAGVVESLEHQNLALEATVKSFVLLKNVKDFLPISPQPSDLVAVLGPMADNYGQLFGDYAARQDRSYTSTPYQGLQLLYGKERVKLGAACADGTPCIRYNPRAVADVLPGASIIYLCLGTGIAVESEGRDRPDLELPGYQKQLLMDVIKQSHSTPVVLLLFNAGPLNVTVAQESPAVPAILECFFPGQTAGQALADVLSNKDNSSSPAGRLPSTWPLLASQVPPMVNYSMEGRTYRYLQVEPLYAFGYGLSYSRFLYSGLVIPTAVRALEDVKGSFVVKNMGQWKADEVAQCYISWSSSQDLPVPQRQLAFFTRLTLNSGGQSKVKTIIPWRSLAFWDKGLWVIQSGKIDIYCGGQQPFQRQRAPSNILHGSFLVENTLRLAKL